MNIRCLFFGCRWGAGVEEPLGPEMVMRHVCQRCGSHRVVSA